MLVFPDTYAALPQALRSAMSWSSTASSTAATTRPSFAPPSSHARRGLRQLLRELVLRLPLDDWLDPERWAHLRELVMDAPGPVKLRLVCSRATAARQNRACARRPLRRQLDARAQVAHGDFFKWREL